MRNLEDFKVIGIDVRTSNQNEQAAQDLGALWQRFFAEGIAAKIPHATSSDLVCLYTDYESDYRGAYTAMLGLQVDSLEDIPEGLSGRTFTGGKYRPFLAKGEMPGAVVQSWQEIWAKDGELQRRYTVDFEVYGPKSQQGSDSEVEIMIAVE